MADLLHQTDRAEVWLGSRARDISGQRFGRWLVTGRAANRRRAAAWNCRCDCGTTGVVLGAELRRGRSQSCGCLARDMTRSRPVWHHMWRSSAWRSWRSMRDRCENPRAESYDLYGGRGISVAPEWQDFRAFYHDMGDRPPGTTLDRIDSDGNYEPGNCRWATTKEQGNNKRSCVYLTIDGSTKTLTEWAESWGLSPRLVSYRYHAGWPIADLSRCALPPGGRR